MIENSTHIKGAERPSLEFPPEVTESVSEIIAAVRSDGDDALRELTARFDGVERESIRVTDEELASARKRLSEEDREVIDETIENVHEFHEEQRGHLEGFEREFDDGVRLGQRVVPIERAGVYVPGGRYPLVASPAMTIVPAVVAGVEHVVACAPPQDDGSVQPAQLYAMDRTGADEIYCVGGAQAIAAMAYGTESVPTVNVVTGPGNAYTTEAKRQVFGHVGVDFLAGPTEVLIIADDTADPELVATDLLAQAEHDTDSRVVLVSLEESLARETIDAVEAQLEELPTAETARACWAENGEVIVAEDRDAAIAVANDYAMEHLQVMSDEPREYVDDLVNYGSLFLGHHSPVVFGDKAVGTNHCLPTLEVSTYTGGIWVGTYLKTLTHQQLTAEGAASIAPHAAKICELEGTVAHRLSAEKRFDGEAERQ
ncbi:histidinol dehydrogenase [Natronosalvus halobius]|uniref:histidinol dehydrogenase n=1 Tax=Natronosalvus halobius TaxID=2953746 RepID=UPI0020A06798|nr:histidinol dehydrogenase [Natronosalvus halobius]USZ73296.1 histidinol dehydrogenase [Natronosalvus halobius]